MDRRQLFGLAALTAPSLAFAQARDARDRELQYVTETLAAGAGAIDTSKLALQKAGRDDIKRFASFEITEQEGLRDVLQSLSDRQHQNAPPTKPKVDTQLTAQNLAQASGESFEKAYVAEQIASHRQMLQVQERYLQNGQHQAFRAVAALARGHIREHLAQLERLG